MHQRFGPLALSLAVGCGKPDLESACKGFVAAANACNLEHADAKAIDSNLLDPSLCVGDTKSATRTELQAAVDRYDCKANAYTDADCSTNDGYDGATAADQACDLQ